MAPSLEDLGVVNKITLYRVKEMWWYSGENSGGQDILCFNQRRGGIYSAFGLANSVSIRMGKERTIEYFSKGGEFRDWAREFGVPRDRQCHFEFQVEPFEVLVLDLFEEEGEAYYKGEKIE